jgi:HEAT repeat protein
MAELSGYLWNGDKIVSRHAAWALTQIRDPKAIDILLERLGEEHDLDLHLLAEYLGEVNDIAFAPLMNALDNGNRWTRREAAFFLREFGSDEALQALKNAANKKITNLKKEITR